MQVSIYDNFVSVRRSDDIEHARKNNEPGDGFVKICLLKNACVGEGRELENTLDDAFGISQSAKKA